MATIPLGTQFIGLPSTYPTAEKRSAQVNAESGVYTMQDIIDTVGGGLEGTQYVFVAADGTDVENAAELQAAYVTAQGMSPSATNRITVIAAPGNYNFDTTNFEMGTEYIDLVSLDGNKSIVFNGSNTIEINANDVFVNGVDVLTKNFTIASGLPLLKIQNCKGGDSSFGGQGGVDLSGTFINCEGGDSAFAGGYGGTASGTFINCIGGLASFAAGGFASFASGIFNNCVGGNSQFGSGSFGGGFGAEANGSFTNCVAGNSAFGGGGGIASGVFTNCTAAEFSFGVFGTLTGKLYYCRLSNGTFETVSGAGVTRLCIDGNNVENNQG